MQIVIDFETVDHGIQAGQGPAWPWGGVNILGCGIKVGDRDAYYETDFENIKEVCNKATTIIAHNAQYEAGILKMMGIDIKDKIFFCTKLGAKLYNNLLPSFALDDLAQEFLGQKKDSNKLLEVGGAIGLYEIPEGYQDPETYYDGDARTLKKFKTARRRMMNLVWANLDRIQAASPVVGNYCIKDVELTDQLHKFWVKEIGEKVYSYYCKLINVSTDMRAKGIRVDIKQTYMIQFKLEGKLRTLERSLWDKFGYFNYNSPAQVKLWAYNKLGLRGFKTPDNKESFGKDWIEQNIDNLDVATFAEVKKLDKMVSFCTTIIEHEKHGRIYPQLNIMQARTGRFSCVNPNVQQIPSRDEEYAPLIRSLFLPEVNEKWFSLDFSSQEPRLQIHYAEAIGSKNGKELADKYRADPRLDLYTEAANMVFDKTGNKITRKDSKIMTLALSYGMGKDKGAKALGVPVKKYTEVRKAYFQGASYLKDLNIFCQERMKERGYLLTIGGRRTFNEPGYEYKALNSLIQGGAFDQTAAALIQAYYDYNILPLNTVHDEINISAGCKEVAEILQDVMQTCININVPSVADIGEGGNWAEAKI
jgi:DNA polymerase I-like protein with 3'-5' exonuclease and polymerase domains